MRVVVAKVDDCPLKCPDCLETPWSECPMNWWSFDDYINRDFGKALERWNRLVGKEAR